MTLSFEQSIRLQELRERQEDRVNEEKTPEEVLRDKEEILARNPENVLVGCYAGEFRSGKVADELRMRGYKALNIGVNSNESVGLDTSQFDAIILMTPKVKEKFLEMHQPAEDIPIRVIGIAESAGFHTQDEEKLKSADVDIADKLDALGFVDKVRKVAS